MHKHVRMRGFLERASVRVVGVDVEVVYLDVLLRNVLGRSLVSMGTYKASTGYMVQHGLK